MYCPNCGDQTTQGLKFCKRCGTSLTAGAVEQAAPQIIINLASLVKMVAAVGIVGVVALFITLGNTTHLDTRAFIAIAAFGGATVVGVVALLVWFLLRLTAGGLPPAQITRGTTKAVREHAQQQIPAPPISMPSVTENTTRNFDSVYKHDRAE